MKYQIISERQRNYLGAIKAPDDAFHLVKRYGNEQKEQFIIITLNGSHEPISVSFASIGLVNRTIIHPREVFVRAIQDMATSIVVCHNHPSGSLRPSAEDKEITKKLHEAGKLLGINVLDHIIFSKRRFMSMRQEGFFKPKEEE